MGVFGIEFNLDVVGSNVILWMKLFNAYHLTNVLFLFYLVMILLRGSICTKHLTTLGKLSMLTAVSLKHINLARNAKSGFLKTIITN